MHGQRRLVVRGEVLGGLPMQQCSLPRPESRVDRLAHQVVDEPAVHDHAHLLGGCQEVGHLVRPPARRRDEQLHVGFPDHAGQLEQLEGLVGQPGEAPFQDLAHADRDLEVRGPAPDLQPGHLAHEERVPARAVMQSVELVVRRNRPGDLRYELPAGRTIQPAELDPAHRRAGQRVHLVA